ncbi:MAG: hypothetical protein U0W40_12430 [Acidimicrobiia bacterium]
MVAITTEPLDLTTDDGRARIAAPAADADVVLTALEPAMADQLGQRHDAAAPTRTSCTPRSPGSGATIR